MDRKAPASETLQSFEPLKEFPALPFVFKNLRAKITPEKDRSAITYSRTKAIASSLRIMRKAASDELKSIQSRIFSSFHMLPSALSFLPFRAQSSVGRGPAGIPLTLS